METFSVLLLRLGLQAEMGVFVVGSKRADFPTKTERLLLNLAANQAVIGLQEARLLRRAEAGRRGTRSSVAQRTSQLLAANKELERKLPSASGGRKAPAQQSILTEGQRISHTGSWGGMFPAERLPGRRNTSESLVSILRRPIISSVISETVHPEDRSFIEQGLEEAIATKAVLTGIFESRLGTDLSSMSRVWADRS